MCSNGERRMPINVNELFTNLQDRAFRSERAFIAEGCYLVERLLASPLETLAILCSDRMADRVTPMAGGRCPLIVKNDREIERLVGFKFHRGIMAAGRRPAARRMEEFFSGCPDARRIVACTNAGSEENLGSIMRTAAALGYDAIAIGSRGSDPWSRRCIRASMGAGFTFPVIELVDAAGDISILKRRGFTVYATVLSADAQPLPGFFPSGPHVLVFGNEADGIAPEWRSRCDRALTIPIARNDSLNVGVAAGIFMYHLSVISDGAMRRDDRS